MKTLSQVYKPSATSYPGKKIELLYPERMLVRTVSGRGFIKYRSTMIPLTEGLAGYPVAIDPHSGPPHDLWFSHHRIGFLTLDAPRPVVDVDVPSFVALNELHKDTNLMTQPALETTLVRQILYPRVRAIARQRISVHLFREVRFDRVEPQPWWLDAGECQDIVSDDDVRLTQDWIRESHVDAEALAVDLARELALSAIAEAAVPPALEIDLRLLESRRS